MTVRTWDEYMAALNRYMNLPANRRADEAAEQVYRSVCPYCDYIAKSIDEEVAHMNSVHRDIVIRRLRNAGLHEEADKLERQG